MNSGRCIKFRGNWCASQKPWDKRAVHGIKARSGDLPRLLQESEEFHYQLLIPQSSTRLLAHSDCRLFVRKGRLIGTSGAKRVINIHDLKNARKQRDLVTPQSIRVAAAVRVLVMTANDRQHRA